MIQMKTEQIICLAIFDLFQRISLRKQRALVFKGINFFSKLQTSAAKEQVSYIISTKEFKYAMNRRQYE